MLHKYKYNTKKQLEDKKFKKNETGLYLFTYNGYIWNGNIEPCNALIINAVMFIGLLCVGLNDLN